MKYKVVKTDIFDPDINSHEWDRANVGYIGVNRWKEFAHAPITSFKILRGDDGISILMHSEEKNQRAECLEQNGMICQDSCMEFFFKPDPLDLNYFNFEFNPKGILHLAIGNGRHGRVLIDEDRATFRIQTKTKDDEWSVKFFVPNEFILKYFKRVAPVCKGNFYKCGDLTDHEHYGVWSEVEVEHPDYHVPDFFGRIEM